MIKRKKVRKLLDKGWSPDKIIELKNKEGMTSQAKEYLLERKALEVALKEMVEHYDEIKQSCVDDLKRQEQIKMFDFVFSPVKLVNRYFKVFIIQSFRDIVDLINEKGANPKQIDSLIKWREYIDDFPAVDASFNLLINSIEESIGINGEFSLTKSDIFHKTLLLIQTVMITTIFFEKNHVLSKIARMLSPKRQHSRNKKVRIFRKMCRKAIMGRQTDIIVLIRLKVYKMILQWTELFNQISLAYGEPSSRCHYA